MSRVLSSRVVQTMPLAHPGDASVFVSSADARLMAFESIDEATLVWVKVRLGAACCGTELCCQFKTSALPCN
jgi:hypothetical protein